MKKKLLLISAILLSISSYAQESIKQTEVGLGLYSLDNFAIVAKTGTEKSLWRLTTLSSSGNKTMQDRDSLSFTSTNLLLGIKLGKEFRKEIAENFELRYGLDFSFRYTNQKSTYDDKSVPNLDTENRRILYESGLNLVFGFNYVLKEKLIIGAEIMPYFNYLSGKQNEKQGTENEEIDISGFSYGLQNGGALLSLSYRF